MLTGLYVLSALLGVLSAALAKAALGRLSGMGLGAALWRAACARQVLGRLVAAVVALSANLLIMVILLQKMELSVVEPIGVGCNLLASAAMAAVFFKEKIDRWKGSGLALIVLGIVLLESAI